MVCAHSYAFDWLCIINHKFEFLTLKVKVKSLYLTSVVPSIARLVSMEADGAPFTSCLCQGSVLQVFKAMATRIRGKSKQTEDRTGDFSLRKLRTSQLSHDCSSRSSQDQLSLYSLIIESWIFSRWSRRPRALARSKMDQIATCLRYLCEVRLSPKGKHRFPSVHRS